MDRTFDNASQRDSVPFRHDIVGSFLRPQSLKEARIKHAKGELSPEALKDIEDEEITRLVKKEIAAG